MTKRELAARVRHLGSMFFLGGNLADLRLREKTAAADFEGCDFDRNLSDFFKGAHERVRLLVIEIEKWNESDRHGWEKVEEELVAFGWIFDLLDKLSVDANRVETSLCNFCRYVFEEVDVYLCAWADLEPPISFEALSPSKG